MGFGQTDNSKLENKYAMSYKTIDMRSKEHGALLSARAHKLSEDLQTEYSPTDCQLILQWACSLIRRQLLQGSVPPKGRKDRVKDE